MRAALCGAVFAALICLWAGSAPAVSVGERAVSIEGEDLYGERVSLEQFLGRKAILLEFGSIYSSTCISSLQEIARIRKNFHSSDLQVVGVNLDVYGRARVRRFFGDYSSLIDYPVIHDDKLAISRRYGIMSVPSRILIDKAGIVRYMSTAAVEKDQKSLEDAVAKVIFGEEGMEKLPRESFLQVFLPVNFSKTYQESVYVVGRTRPGSRIALILNGGSRQELRTMRDYFYIRTQLSLGSNYIELQLTDHKGKKTSQGVVIFRSPKIGIGIDSPFPEYHFHVEKNEAICRKCHELNPAVGKAKGFTAATRFCLGCHKELTGQRMVHGPIPVGGCAPCHKFDSSPNKYQVMARGQELCFKCHEEKRKDLVRTYLHGPMSAGLCAICHNPHGSSEPYQLRRYTGDLCVMCHEGLKSVQRRKVVHRPVADGACAKCHEPHSSERNDNFLKQPGDRLCLSCHSDFATIGHTHPTGVLPKMERKLKLGKDGNLSCQSCHEPHSSDEPKLLVKGGCSGCHS
jgi:predicted CXXCH cytochrome family protein